MSRLPGSWVELLERLGLVLGDRRAADVWCRQAVEALWGEGEPGKLSRPLRSVAFQKLSGVLLLLEERGIPRELVDGAGGAEWVMFRDGSMERADGRPSVRDEVSAAFARYFDGVRIDGPAWRVSVREDRPDYEEWAAAADFGEPEAQLKAAPPL